MANTRHCRDCSHFLELPMPNGDPTMYWCSNRLTKSDLYQIGFLDKNAPSCPLFSQACESVSDELRERIAHSFSFERAESLIMQAALLAALVLGLAGWLRSDFAREFGTLSNEQNKTRIAGSAYQDGEPKPTKPAPHIGAKRGLKELGNRKTVPLESKATDKSSEGTEANDQRSTFGASMPATVSTRPLSREVETEAVP